MGASHRYRRARVHRRIALLDALEPRQLLTTWYVDASSPGPTHTGASWSAAYADLQAALSGAQPGDTIQVADGTYKPTATADRTVSFKLKGGVSLYGGYAGYGAPNPDARDTALYPTILSGDIGVAGSTSDNSYHVLYGTYVDPNGAGVIDGFTVTEGNANGSAGNGLGGGLYVDADLLSMSNCTFVANNASYGGGVCESSNLLRTYTNCTFLNNTANYGGAFCTFGGGPLVTGCSFASNSSYTAGGAFEVMNTGQATLANCTFTDNAVTAPTNGQGGAIGQFSASGVTLTGCTFTRNRVTSATGGKGGAVYGTLAATSCVFAGNSAGSQGGAVCGDGSVVQCVFVGNTVTGASGFGGALANVFAIPSVTNSTFVANAAPSGKAGAAYGATLTNCVVWQNVAPLSAQLPAGVTVTYSDVDGGYAGTGNLATDPLFLRNPTAGADGAWGTPDDDYGDLRVSPASPVTDVGNNGAPGLAGVTTDLAGGARFRDVPTTADAGSGTAPMVDMGAYEAVPGLDARAGGPYVVLRGQALTLNGRGASDAAGPLAFAWEWTGDGQFDEAASAGATFPTSAYAPYSVVTVTLRVTDSSSRVATDTTTITILPAILYVDTRARGAGNGATWADAFTDLSTALTQAVPGQEIRVATGTYRPTSGTDRNASISLRNGVTIEGGYGGLGAADPDARDLVAHPSILSGDIGAVGDSSDNSYHVVFAQYVNASAVLDGFTITACSTTGSTGTGGTLQLVSAGPVISNCVVTGNSGLGAFVGSSSAPQFVDVSFDGNPVSSDTSSSVVLTGCSVMNCKGTGLYAGGFAQLYGCSFTNNQVADVNGNGGAVYANALLAATNCSFTGNAAGGSTSSRGGAVYLTTGISGTFTNCSFTSNSAGSGNGGGFAGSGTFINCTFTGNTAALGGGANVGTSTFTGCTFTRNSALTAGTGASGGGLYSSNGTLKLTSCVFYGNMAVATGITSSSSGGGLAASTTTTLINCAFVGNVVSPYNAIGGGAAFLVSGNSVVGCAFANNSARGSLSAGGGLYANNSGTTIANSIFWANTAAGNPQYRVSTGAPFPTYCDIQGGSSGTGNVNTAPLFARNPGAGKDGTWGTADDDYGDLWLLPGSLCVDAGSNAAIPAGVTTDLAGNPRTYDFPGAGTPGAATVDMGAYELTNNLGSLHVAAGQTVALPAGGYSFSATQLTIDAGGTLDLADDALLIDYTGASPLAVVRSALRSGRNGGVWDGTGIVSSAARTTPNRGIGYAEATELGLTTFAGQPVDSTSLLLKYTTAGDASLDGRINGDDYALADRGKAKGLGTWVFGDFDYDAAVTAADYAILDAAAAPPPAPAPVAAAEPEANVAAAVEPVAAAVDPAPAPAAIAVTPAKAAAVHAKAAPAKAKPKSAKRAPAAKPKPKPKAKVKPAPKSRPKPKAAPHAAAAVRNKSRTAHSSHPISHR